MDTALMVTSEPTRAGKVNSRHGSSDCLTPLRPERESYLNPTAALKAREWCTAHEMHDPAVLDAIQRAMEVNSDS